MNCFYESAQETARINCSSDEYRRIYLDERKKVEMSFAHMKQHLGFSKLRFWGLKSANDEFLLVAIAQNHKNWRCIVARHHLKEGLVRL